MQTEKDQLPKNNTKDISNDEEELEQEEMDKELLDALNSSK
jgi:hypothetical protein